MNTESLVPLSKKRKLSVVQPRSTTSIDDNFQTFPNDELYLFKGAETVVCNLCKMSLTADYFSKSKMNHYQRHKIDFITCSSCTEKRVAKNDVDKKVLKLQRAQANSSQAKMFTNKINDPSLFFINDPLRTPVLREANYFFKRVGVVYPIHLGPVEGWRTVAKLAVRCVIKQIRSQLTPITTIGLFQPGTHSVLPGSMICSAHHPSVNFAAAAVEQTLKILNIHGYIEGSGYDEEEAKKYHTYLKYVMIAVERKTMKIQLTLVWNSTPDGTSDANSCLSRLVESLSVTEFSKEVVDPSTDDSNTQLIRLFHSIWVNFNPSSRHNNAITGRGADSWRLLYGIKCLRERVVTDMNPMPTLRFPPMVFRQANIDSFTNIIQSIRNCLKGFAEQKPDKIGRLKCLELYGGVGTIGLNCLDLLGSLHCSDENPFNKKCFEATYKKLIKAAKRHSLEIDVGQDVNLTRLCGSAVYESLGAATVAEKYGLSDCDVVIVDPPRKGLDEQVIRALLCRPRSFVGTQRLLYVSCGFQAFKRDCSRLLGLEDSNTKKLPRGELKWKLVHAEGHVLFPGSDHVETFAVFDR